MYLPCTPILRNMPTIELLRTRLFHRTNEDDTIKSKLTLLYLVCIGRTIKKFTC